MSKVKGVNNIRYTRQMKFRQTKWTLVTGTKMVGILYVFVLICSNIAGKTGAYLSDSLEVQVNIPPVFFEKKSEETLLSPEQETTYSIPAALEKEEGQNQKEVQQSSIPSQNIENQNGDTTIENNNEIPAEDAEKTDTKEPDAIQDLNSQILEGTGG